MPQPGLTEASLAIAGAWPWFWPSVAAVLGGVLGSFFGCALYRLPRGLSLRHPPSACMACNTRLTVPDLIPVVSYLALRGKCRHCGTPYGSTTLWLELACAAILALAAALLQARFLS